MILIGYLPVVVASSLIAIHYYKKRGEGKTAVAPPVAERPVPEVDGYEDLTPVVSAERRLLADEATEDEYDNLMDRLISLFESEKLYLDPGIRVSEVATRLLTNKSGLSTAIRIKTGKNFCQLVHYYRVKEAMRLYMRDESLTITQLQKRVGFNSMTTFNTAFGRNTGFTPAEWCKNYRKKVIRDNLKKR